MNYPLIIGGSAGSFVIVKKIISGLSNSIPFPMIVCIHRLKTSSYDLSSILKGKSKIKVTEVEDGEIIKTGRIYVAPANCHLKVDRNFRLMLTKEDPVQYSRPSIDITMVSFSEIYKEKLVGILLTGANSDGTIGMKTIKERGGITIVQDPKDAEIPSMPQFAINSFQPDYILSTDKIINFIEKLTSD